MRRILAGVVIVGLALSLEACPKPVENNVSENVSVNETVDMNATDMNATDMNATDMNATDMNGLAPVSGDQGSTDHKPGNTAQQ